jgi:hypothetical protein
MEEAGGTHHQCVRKETMKVYAQKNADDPTIVDFYANGEKIENMYCLKGVHVSTDGFEATARVVAPKGTGATAKAAKETK